MKNIYFFTTAIFLCVVSQQGLSQVAQNLKNYTVQKVYDEDGQVVSYVQTYLDKLGRTQQVQQKDIENGNVIVQQYMYDRFGRQAGQSLPAPVYKTTTDSYLPNFISNTSNQTYNYDSFDSKPTAAGLTGETYNPSPISNLTKGELGWYYSNNNNEESHVPASSFPYNRQVFSNDYFNRLVMTSMAGNQLKIGSGKEKRVIFKHPSDELKYVLNTEARYWKSVIIDEEGLEEVHFADREGKLIAKCYSGFGIDNCIPKVQTYRLNYHNNSNRFIDLHLPVGSNLEIEKVLPTSDCLTETPDVMITLVDLITGYSLVEGTDYSINSTTHLVSFIGNYFSQSNFIKVKIEYPKAWLLCASNAGSMQLNDQVINVFSSYGDVSLYRYDEKGNLITVIPPNGVDCEEFDFNLSSVSTSEHDVVSCYGILSSNNTCTPNHIQNTNIWTSNVFNLNEPETYKYNYRVWVGGESIPYFFENGTPDCDYDNNTILVNFENVFNNSFDLETGEHSVPEPEEEEGFFVEDIDLELRERQYATELFYSRTAKPEIDLGEVTGEVDYFGKIDDFIETNFQNGVSTNAITYSITEGETDTASVTNVLARKRNGPTLYDQLANGGGLGSGPGNPTACVGWGHCTNGVRDCEETGVDIGGGCENMPVCYNKPLKKIGTFKVLVNALAKSNTTNSWEAVDVFRIENKGAMNAIITYDDEYFEYYDLMYDCECNYYLNKQYDPVNTGEGHLDEQFMTDYSQIKFDIANVSWAPHYPGVNVFRNVNTHRIYEFLAHFITMGGGGTLSGQPHITSPQHDLSQATTYEYNFRNQVTRVTTPDEGESNIYYDDLNRVKFSQTAEQAANNQYAYIDYDALGRTIESGILTSTTFPQSSLNGLVSESSFVLSEQSMIEYDEEGSGFPSYLPSTDYKHNFLKGKVAKTSNDESSTWYGYDMRGRLSWTVQEVKNYQDTYSKFFTINYSYNKQGNLETLDLQKEEVNERFTHHYDYDANGKMTTVSTSKDGKLANATLNATYYYYQHGPLKRVELGDKLQGIDYVYTINNRLKSINNPVTSRDPGADGLSGSTHSDFAKDVFGMTLDYFQGDYVRNGTGIQTYTQNFYSAQQQEWVAESGKFDGTIQGVRWNTKTQLSGEEIPLQGLELIYMPQYDARKRLVSADFGTINAANIGTQNTGVFSPGYIGPKPITLQDYKVSGIEYDPNGNILKLQRNGYSGASTDMDDLIFNRNGNQISNISDVFGAGLYSTDIDNQSVNNYSYDASGRMIGDAASQNYIQYFNNNLTKNVFADAGLTLLKSSLAYDERGKRLRKRVFDIETESFSEQFYIRDVNGILLAVINKDAEMNTTSENLVYGSTQWGTFNPNGGTNGKYSYQITDHLGNVRATIDDELKNDKAQLLSLQDYYPFGSVMPGRSVVSSSFYKQGYQGQQFDAETNTSAFELRLYDARLGSWLSPDPYKQHFSPYMAMSNNPFSFIDPDGGWDDDGTNSSDYDNDWRLNRESWGSYNRILAAQEACPECSGSQIGRLALASGTGRYDIVMKGINDDLNKLHGTFAWLDTREIGADGKKIGKGTKISKSYINSSGDESVVAFIQAEVRGIFPVGILSGSPVGFTTSTQVGIMMDKDLNLSIYITPTLGGSAGGGIFYGATWGVMFAKDVTELRGLGTSVGAILGKVTGEINTTGFGNDWGATIPTSLTGGFGMGGYVEFGFTFMTEPLNIRDMTVENLVKYVNGNIPGASFTGSDLLNFVHRLNSILHK